MTICKHELELLYGGEYRGGLDLTPQTEYECILINKGEVCPHSNTICNYKKQKLKEKQLEKLIKSKEEYYKGL